MATTDIYNLKHEKVGEMDLDDDVFSGPVKEHLFWEVVRQQMASRRAGTHSTQTRAEVTGTGRKPFKQKGTGRARQGDCKVNIMKGGGVVFGPRPRDYSYKTPKKVRRAACRSALSRRFHEQKLFVVDSMELAEIKTKQVKAICSAFGFESAIFVDERNENLKKSARNLPTVQYLAREGLNVYDILRYENIVISKAAVEQITGALSK